MIRVYKDDLIIRKRLLVGTYIVEYNILSDTWGNIKKGDSRKSAFADEFMKRVANGTYTTLDEVYRICGAFCPVEFSGIMRMKINGEVIRVIKYTIDKRHEIYVPYARG